MKYKLFGDSGLRVSEICLGTMTFGEDFGWGSSKDESRSIFDAFVEANGNFFDTANFYTRGTSEVFLGEFIAPAREKYVVATKYTLSCDPKNPNAGGNQRKNLIQSVHQSLKRLKTEYIDLLWIHAWDRHTPIEETMRALDDLVRQGKVLYIGASDTPAWVVAQANTLAYERGWTKFIGLQLEYSLIERTIEREFFDLSQYLGTTITAWSPLGMGVLSGKYLGKSAKTRFDEMDEWKASYVTERNQRIAQVVVDIAKECGKAPTQVALRWMHQASPGVIPIIGVRHLSQFKENIDYFTFSLSDEQMKRLDDVSCIPQGFPESFLNSDRVKRIMYGDCVELLEVSV